MFRTSLRLLLLVAVVAVPVWNRSPEAARERLGYLASSLSADSPAEALSVFDKSYPEYEKLSRFFSGLRAYQVQNEVEVVEELDAPSETRLTVNWTLTLTEPTSNATERRTAEIKVLFELKEKSWKIVSFAPTDIFDPASRR